MSGFYRNQTEAAEAIKRTIDSHWAGEANERRVEKEILELWSRNQDVVCPNHGFGSIILHRLGKRRVSILKRILEQNGISMDEPVMERGEGQ